MFWLRKKTKKADKAQPDRGENRQRQSSEKIRKQALTNAREAREHIGEETLQKIAAAMVKKENSPLAQARKTIQSSDSGRVMQELRYMKDEGR